MKFFVLLAGFGEMPVWDELTAEEQEALMAKHVAFDEACAGRPGVEIVIESPAPEKYLKLPPALNATGEDVSPGCSVVSKAPAVVG